MTVQAALKKIYSKPNGREKSMNDVIFWGVANKPYAGVKELKAAGCKFNSGQNGLFGWPDRENMKRLLEFLLKNDGYLG